MQGVKIFVFVTFLAAGASQAVQATEIPTPNAEQRQCSSFLSDEKAKSLFHEHWKARIAAASPDADPQAIDRTVDIFGQVALGYCQAGGEQPVPLLDDEDPPFEPVLNDNLIMDYLERLNDSVESEGSKAAE